MYDANDYKGPVPTAAMLRASETRRLKAAIKATQREIAKERKVNDLRRKLDNATQYLNTLKIDNGR